MLYHFPNLKENGILSKVTNGWWVGSIVAVQTGYAFTPMLASNRSQDATLGTFPDRANLGTASVTSGIYNFIPYDKNNVTIGTAAHWFNPLMFTQSTIVPCPGLTTLNCGTLGNAGKGILRGPRLGTWDFSLTKDTALGFLGEGGNLQIRAEIFNMLNRTNFGMPNGTVFPGGAANASAYSSPQGAGADPLGTVGQITTTSTNSRQVQLAVRISF